MTDTTRIIVFAAIVPVVLACAMLAVFRRRGKNEGDDRPASRRANWALLLALGGGAVSGFIGTGGWPEDSWQRLTWLPVAGLVVGALMQLTSRVWWLRGLMIAVIAAATGFILLPFFQDGDPFVYKVIPFAGTFVAMVVLESLAVRRRASGLLFAIGLSIAATIAIVIGSGSIKMPMGLAGAGAALFVCWMVSCVRTKASLADGPLAVLVPLLVCTPLVGRAYIILGDPPSMWCFILPCSGLLLAWGAELFEGRRPRFVAPVMRIGPALLAGAAAAWLMFGVETAESTDDDELDYDYESMMYGASEHDCLIEDINERKL